MLAWKELEEGGVVTRLRSGLCFVPGVNNPLFWGLLPLSSKEVAHYHWFFQITFCLFLRKALIMQPRLVLNSEPWLSPYVLALQA